MTVVKNGVPFRQNLVSPSKYNIKCPYDMDSKKITLHETDNNASAENEIAYMIRNDLKVSFHVAIDEKEVVQGIPFNRNAWHSGDGGNGYGNRNTIAVEICKAYDRNSNTTNLVEPQKSQHAKAEQNAIRYVAQLCIDEGIIANNENIKTHNDWNGKLCPRKILTEKRLQDVKNKIIAEYNRSIDKKTDEVIINMLANWQEEMGTKSLDSLSKKKDGNGNLIVNSPEDWKKTLPDSVPQWLFWGIIDRITK